MPPLIRICLVLALAALAGWYAARPRAVAPLERADATPEFDDGPAVREEARPRATVTEDGARLPVGDLSPLPAGRALPARLFVEPPPEREATDAVAAVLDRPTVTCAVLDRPGSAWVFDVDEGWLAYRGGRFAPVAPRELPELVTRRWPLPADPRTGQPRPWPAGDGMAGAR